MKKSQFKLNVNFFDKMVVKRATLIVSFISAILSFVLVFLPLIFVDLPSFVYAIIFGSFILAIIIIYIITFLHYKTTDFIDLKINNNDVHIMFGDLLNCNGNKVINFTEYFDTDLNDPDIIGFGSLNYLFLKSIESIPDLDKSIENDVILQKYNFVSNCDRSKGKTKKYKLGSVHRYRDYFLVAFSQINQKFEAEFQTMNDYFDCLINIWKNLNAQYDEKDIYIPLLGGGRTRFREKVGITDQEKLEYMIKSLEISNTRFKNCKIHIVLYPGNLEKNECNYENFNFSRIKYLYK